MFDFITVVLVMRNETVGVHAVAILHVKQESFVLINSLFVVVFVSSKHEIFKSLERSYLLDYLKQTHCIKIDYLAFIRDQLRDVQLGPFTRSLSLSYTLSLIGIPITLYNLWIESNYRGII